MGILKRTWLYLLLFLLICFVGLFFCAPKPLFDVTYSTVVESSDDILLGAKIAKDEQWRFPEIDSIPAKYEKCVLNFEDKYFNYHPGINPVSLFRALIQNVKQGKVISGGSTITMQLCRIARGHKKRTIKNKIVEMIWALSLELRYTKDQILKMYASHAPFGGNVIGVETASWRYFSRPPTQLSWAESAVLAVLPNSPSLIYPGRQEHKLKYKRDRLLKKLYDLNEIDSLTYQLSVAEPIPEKVTPLPLSSYHLVEKAAKEKQGERVQTTIDFHLQERIAELVKRQNNVLAANQIHNLAVLVSEIGSGEVKAYIGNVFDEGLSHHNNHVDIIQANRSTGSILKPFLYCKMLDEGLITPAMLIADIPTRFGGFTPMNFDLEYNGAVRADRALARSLNIPAVKMLQDYGVAPFYSFLQNLEMKSLNNKPEHYGLSLILGGAEVSLWELTGMYNSLTTILSNYNLRDGGYQAQPFKELSWIKSHSEVQAPDWNAQPRVRAAAIYETLNAMLEVERPGSEAGWEDFYSKGNVAWKTGTSFGFRDAWALGINSKYVIGVWAGNADGEGRPGLTGINAAAPVLFDVFALLPTTGWFEKPVDEMDEITVCAQSGHRAGINCEHINIIQVPTGSKVEACPWHKKVHLNKEQTHRVNAECYPVTEMEHRNWFVLPPAMEYFYKNRDPSYRLLPPMFPGCESKLVNMEFIYPREWNKVFIPTQLDGTQGKIIFELIHRETEMEVFWHLDDKYLGSTVDVHQIALHPDKGWHVINVTDKLGSQITKRFFVVDNEH